jgi:CRP-like cAMP-binding protein
MIPETLLLDFGAEKKFYHKKENLFSEGQHADYFHQVFNGEVKMNNYNEAGKEFIQSIFSSGRSFGEPPLFADIAYPANAEAVTDAEVFRLKKTAFFDLLHTHPDVHLEVTKTLSLRLYYKAIMATELSYEEPAHRIVRFLDYLKQDVYKKEGRFSFQVNLTRQQIADLTGLRVETVIRTVKKLAKNGELKIEKRKIYR